MMNSVRWHLQLLRHNGEGVVDLEGVNIGRAPTDFDQQLTNGRVSPLALLL